MKAAIELDPVGFLVTSNGTLVVDLGNGVTLKTRLPAWIEAVNAVSIELTLSVEGSPHANANSTSVQ